MKHLWLLAIIACLCLSGCWVTDWTRPKTDTMKESVARSTIRRTTKPKILTTKTTTTTYDEQGDVVEEKKDEDVTVVGEEEEVSSVVEFGKKEPVVKKRSIWTRWWWWLGIVIVITWLGGWPLVIRAIRRLRERAREAIKEMSRSQHALRTVTKQIDTFKKDAALDPKKDDAEHLRSILNGQDDITVEEVRKLRK